MAAAPPGTRRTASLSGSARLGLSVLGRSTNPPSAQVGAGRHPLKQEWSISYVHRPPGAKVDYEKEIRKVATFGSIESFLRLYAHLTPPNDLPAVTDVLVFLGRIGRPGVWEEMQDGGKFTLRLLKTVTPILFESLLFALIGDQFAESDSVVGCVLSVRQTEDILSVWVEEEGEGVKSGALKEKILTLLGLPGTTMCEYRSNRALLDAASKPLPAAYDQTGPYDQHPHSNQHPHQHHQQHHGHHQGGRFEHAGGEGGRTGGSRHYGDRNGNGYREPRERSDREPRDHRPAAGEYRDRDGGGEGGRREWQPPRDRTDDGQAGYGAQRGGYGRPGGRGQGLGEEGTGGAGPGEGERRWGPRRDI